MPLKIKKIIIMKKITLLVIVLLSYCGLNAQIDCNNAITITPDLYTMSEYLVNSQVPTPLCADVNGPVPANRPPRGSWYKFTPTQNLTVTVTTDIIENNPRIDTRFHVYKGSCDNLICHSGDDDAGVGENNYSSIATFQVEANQTYYLVNLY
jgi:hypothetical protein